MTGVISRRATAGDLDQITQVWFENELKDVPLPVSVPPPPTPSGELYRHDIETGEMYVATRQEAVVGFSCSIVRGRVRYLSDLFVRSDVQSRGIGRELLGLAMPNDGRIHVTLSSRDFRAQGLYVRAGMSPRWPHFSLRGGRPWTLGRLPAGVEAAEAGAEDRQALETMDEEIGGRSRPMDHEHWLRRRRAIPLWFVRDRERVGYGYVQTESPQLLSDATIFTIGPVGAIARGDAAAIVAAAVAWAAGRAPEVAIAVPGPHPALAPLMHAGFRISYVELFQSSPGEFFDPERYVPSGSELF